MTRTSRAIRRWPATSFGVDAISMGRPGVRRPLPCDGYATVWGRYQGDGQAVCEMRGSLRRPRLTRTFTTTSFAPASLIPTRVSSRTRTFIGRVHRSEIARAPLRGDAVDRLGGHDQEKVRRSPGDRRRRREHLGSELIGSGTDPVMGLGESVDGDGRDRRQGHSLRRGIVQFGVEGSKPATGVPGSRRPAGCGIRSG